MSAIVSPHGRGSVEVSRPDRPPRPQVRRTRLWMSLLLLTPVCLFGIAILVLESKGPAEPTVKPLSTPPGYQAITDAYYGYAVPASYSQNTTWTDQNGDFFYGTGKGGWVAETMLVTKHSPGPATAPPVSFRSFGENKPTPYTVSGGHAVRVADTAFAYEVDITRPGGWHAVAVDTWLSDSTTQMWLLVKASPPVTQTVISSLRGS
jgi:hypothetical protein